MNQAKKLLFYIVLNIIVSAVTIIAVLYIWEKTQLKDVLLNSGSSSPEAGPIEGEDGGEGGQDLLIEIGEVGGIGNLATEYVRLIRPDSDPGDTVSLQGWRLMDEDNQDYVILEQSGLPSLDLHGQGAVNIYSKEGASTPIELYLGLSDPMWEPGETVSLIDPDGSVHDTYLIP
jgi:hypothetical protein